MHDDIRHNGTKHEGFICDTQKYDTQHTILVEIRYAVCRIFKCYAECHYAECRGAKCHYAECRCAECHYAECRSAFIREDKLLHKSQDLFTAFEHIFN